MSAVGFLSYFAEYAAFIVVLAWISDMLTVTLGTGAAGYALVGTISGAYLVLSGAIAIPMGHLADKFGRRRMAIVGCLLGSSGLFSLLFIGRISSVFAFLLAISAALTAMGLGHATYTASTLAYVGDVSSEEDLGKSYGLIEDVEFAAYAFGPGAGGVIAVIIGREPTFLLSATLLLSAAITAAVFMREKGVRLPGGLISPPRLIDAVEPPLVAWTDPELQRRGVSWRGFLEVLKDPTIAVTIATTVVISLAFTAFFIYVSLYAQNLSAVPLVRAVGAASGSLMAATCILVMIPVGHYEDVSRRRMPILVGGMLMGSLALAVVFSSPSVATFLFCSLLFGVALAMVRVSQYVILSERSGTANRATVMGTNHAFEHSGYGMGALAGGVMTAAFGSATTFRYLAAILLISGLVFFLFAMRRKIR